MAITTIQDLNYNTTLRAFLGSVKRLENNWAKQRWQDPFTYKDDMLNWAARRGNLEIVKFLMKEKGANPNADTQGFFKTILASTIYMGNGSKNSSFRDVAIYLIDNGADPAAGNNEALRAAKESSIAMFKGEQSFGSHPPKPEHDKVVVRLLQEPSVVKTIIEQNQTEFMDYIPEVRDIFVF